jgi:hypothetical protein
MILVLWQVEKTHRNSVKFELDEESMIMEEDEDDITSRGQMHGILEMSVAKIEMSGQVDYVSKMLFVFQDYKRCQSLFVRYTGKSSVKNQNVFGNVKQSIAKYSMFIGKSRSRMFNTRYCS